MADCRKWRSYYVIGCPFSVFGFLAPSRLAGREFLISKPMSPEVLSWLLPSGGLLTLLTFFLSRRRKKEEDIFAVFNLLKLELSKVQKENLKLYDAIRELSAAIALAGRCPHYDDCPIADRLPRQQAVISALDDSQGSSVVTPSVGGAQSVFGGSSE